MVSITKDSQSSPRNMTKKALLAALAIASTTTSTEAFQPITMVASFGSSRTSSTKLNYVVYGGDKSAANNIEIEKPKKTKTVRKTDSSSNYNHGYIVSNHDNERSFWLHALQNLEPSPESPSSNQSLWTRIACAYGPKEFRETSRITQKGADLVRVGDTDLDIALAVPSDSWNPSSLDNGNVVSAAESRGNRELVTIRVEFPEGSSFDKDAFTFEDELTAVIEQVRLLEQNANDKLSKMEESKSA